MERRDLHVHLLRFWKATNLAAASRGSDAIQAESFPSGLGGAELAIGARLPDFLVASSSLVARSGTLLFAEVLTDQGGQPDACLLQPLLHVRLELLLVRLARLPRLLDCITQAAPRGL